MTLYNVKTHPQGFLITKFDEDLEVESSYTMPLDAANQISCTCPQAERRAALCRHLKMLPLFLKRQRVDTAWFFDFDTYFWHHIGEEGVADEPLENEPKDTPFRRRL